jgi:ADP-dependent NAD(P)H-hydrate dehydratase / NAD(P)H-hydrate epimerase
MKVLTASEMRRIDQQTVDAGIPSLVLMENAGHRVVEYLEGVASPLSAQRIVIFCGKGNNGGDGLVVARQLLTRYSPRSLHVVLTGNPETMQGDAASNLKMFQACGGRVATSLSPDMQAATLLIDAMLGTGLEGPAREPALGFIRAWNHGFPLAKRVAIDVPSGMGSDATLRDGEFCHVDACVTFTALRLCHTLPPWRDNCGEIVVGQIGTPADMLRADSSLRVSQIQPQWLEFAVRRRDRASHKGDYGHVLVLGGSRGKSGAVGMAGMAALRAGAGLVTVASTPSSLASLGVMAPELMSVPLHETADGFLHAEAINGPAGDEVLGGKSVIAAGPGLGVVEDTRQLILSLLASVPAPLVLDADALNVLALEAQWPGDGLLVLTPHPGEMARLMKTTTADIQNNRLARARELAIARNATVVLKGQQTIIAFPDEEVWINPTGNPGMATAGSGDILCGMIAAFLAQFPSQPKLAVASAVYTHGLAGDLAAAEQSEVSLMATDLLRYLPAAFRQVEGK